MKIFRFVKRRKVLSLLLFFLLAFSLFAAYFILTLPDVKPFINGVPGHSSMINQRLNESQKAGKKLIIRRKWTPLGRIPELLRKAVLVSEDIDFYNHKGIDYFELKESIKKNLLTGKKSRGGSTITQQLAKNLFLSTEKSYYRKIRELFIAKRMEKHLTKDRILELYLNIIEFGRGIFGCGAASEYFFHKKPEQLTVTEILRLVAVIPKPLRVTPLSDSGYMKWRVNLLAERLFRTGSVDLDTYGMIKSRFKE